MYKEKYYSKILLTLIIQIVSEFLITQFFNFLFLYLEISIFLFVNVVN